MTIAEWLVATMVSLKNAGVDSPRRDALVLLEDTLEKDRAWVLAHSEYALNDGELKRVNLLIEERLQRIPLAYIRGKAWFYGRFFEVNQSVLIPRPESESFIELLKELRPKKIIDIGTGSGALAVTAKLELPEIEVIATDMSSEALIVAQKNAQTHHVDITFISGNLLMPISDSEALGATIITNLPYVPHSMQTQPELALEPPEALYSGQDGLDHYREFWKQLKNREIQPTHILTESLELQHPALERLAAKAGYHLKQTDVLVQLFTSV
jgi:release factor glutamine methyltransferase